ncbi:hypothetical protein L4D20_04095 [Vibrio kyushuensis]|uniref:hypothetical protein n=1 Tax=Vibrio kyushuensis TaxID=2910249 RepID=UPI003D0A665D
MANMLESELYRSLGAHAVIKLDISEQRIVLIVAPWSDLDNQITAVFKDIALNYVEVQLDPQDESVNLDLPWDIIRLDSSMNDNITWHFGLCCSDIIIGFDAPWPSITFSNKE